MHLVCEPFHFSPGRYANEFTALHNCHPMAFDFISTCSLAARGRRLKGSSDHPHELKTSRHSGSFAGWDRRVALLVISSARKVSCAPSGMSYTHGLVLSQRSAKSRVANCSRVSQCLVWHHRQINEKPNWIWSASCLPTTHFDSDIVKIYTRGNASLQDSVLVYHDLRSI